MELREENCVGEKNRSRLAIRNLTGGIHSMALQAVDKKALTTPEVSGELLIVWMFRLKKDNRIAIKRMVSKKAVIDLDKMALQNKSSCLSCVDETVPNVAVKSITTVESQPSTVLYNYVSKMSLNPLVELATFLTFMEEASGHVSDLHINT